MPRYKRTKMTTIMSMAYMEDVEDERSPQDDAAQKQLHLLFGPVLSEPIPESMLKVLKIT